MLRQRLNSSLLLWSILLLIVWCFKLNAIAFLCVLVAVGAIVELLKLFKADTPVIRFNACLSGLFLAFSYVALRHEIFDIDHIYALAFIILFHWSVFVAKTAKALFLSLFCFFYLTLNIHFLFKIAHLFLWNNTTATLVILWVVLITKTTDIGAFCVGCSCGKHPLLTTVSPKKTREGVLGGILIALLVNVLFYVCFAKHLPILFIKSCVFTVCLAWGAVLSDLVESLLKRHLSVKDSGNIIPGIGGILDLVDSLLLNAPLAYWLLKYGV